MKLLNYITLKKVDMLEYLNRDVPYKELQEKIKPIYSMTEKHIHNFTSRFIFIVSNLDNFII